MDSAICVAPRPRCVGAELRRSWYRWPISESSTSGASSCSMGKMNSSSELACENGSSQDLEGLCELPARRVHHLHLRDELGDLSLFGETSICYRRPARL